ncbi:MAG: T9SS type A sorting domain-containing protein [Candidatus Cloacimonetes bacterium]|nr:T9SS type A sorting domain-containing protein [Candidatus Cloacimonadota bacterium]
MKRLISFVLFLFLTSLIFAQNNCLTFDGEDDYISISNESNFDFSSTLTIEAWIYAESVQSQWTGVVTKGDNAWRIQFTSGGLLNFSTGGGSIQLSESILNGWYHIACVADGSNLYIYLNGRLEVSGNQGGNIHTSNEVVNIGNTTNMTGRYFDGLIDEVRIWSDVRDISEIRQNMYRELNGDEQGLTGYYKFSESSGTSLNDATSGNNDGTLTNMSGDEWVNSGAFAGPRRCLDFDGSDNYVEIPNLAESSSGTIEMWILPDATDAENPILGNGAVGNLSLALRVTSDYKLRFSAHDGSWHEVYSDAGTVSTTEWIHIAAAWNGSTASIYINGIYQNNVGCSSPTSFGGNWHIGGSTISGTMDYFAGTLDEVRIWNDARSDEEIQNNMCRTLDGDEDNLVAYYRFDQLNTDGQTTLYDITTNRNNGTLYNMDPTADWVECTAFDTWIGWFDTSWGDSKNWSRGVPDNSENVGIFKWTLGHTPTIGSSSSAKSLVIGLLETLILNSSLSIYGNLYELGELTHNSQTVTCAGSGAQFLVGSLDFYDLVINNSSSDKKVSAWWTTSLQVDNNLTVTDGIFYSKSYYKNVNIAADGTLELSGNITVSGNWDNDGTFTHNDHKVTFDGSASQTIDGNNSTTFYDMTVTNTSGVVLGNSNTVNHTLDLNNDSKVTLGSNTLTIGSSGSITNYDADSYIVTNSTGVLKRKSVGGSNVTFPIGNAAYNPVIINNGGIPDNFSVKVTDGTPSSIVDATRVVNRTWTITEDVAGWSDALLMLQWNGGETGGNFDIENQLVMGRYLGSGTNWETKSASWGGTGPYAAAASGFTSFSDFVVASGGSGTLPVILSTFTAQFIENIPTIHWSTQSELDNMGWFIYRNEENNFSSSEVISDMIEGQGTTTQQQFYTYEDDIENPEVGDTYYYWLESVDYSGIIQHYDRVAILTIPDTHGSNNNLVPVPERFGLFQNEPNPVVSSTRIAFNLPETAKVDLAIYNLKGQLVKKLYSGKTSKHTVMWDGKDEDEKKLENGVYFYRLIVNGKIEGIRKLILMK